MELCDQTIHQLHRRRGTGEISTVEIVRSVLARLEKVEPTVHAFISVQAEGALERAEQADAELAGGGRISPIAGMPLAIKDIFVTQGIPTTCGSRILRDFRPPYDATVVERLKAHGLNLIGKTN
ncbi:MAG: amidase, partial [bacterium]